MIAHKNSAVASPIPIRLLITGVAGVAGYNALAWFQARYPGWVIRIRQADAFLALLSNSSVSFRQACMIDFAVGATLAA